MHIGVDAVQERLKTKGLKKIPSTKSIERILKESGMSSRYRSEDEQTKPQLLGTKTHRTKMMEGLHKKTEANRQPKSGRNTYTNQVNSRKQNPSWTFKLLQGKVGLDELKNGLSGKLDQKDIQKLHKYVLNNPLRQRNRATIVISFLYGVPKSKISS